MRSGKSIFSKLVSLLLVVLVVLFARSAIVAQEKQDAPRDKAPPPSQEVFTGTDALAWPRAASACDGDFQKAAGCNDTPKLEMSLERKIYNEDGSVWYRYQDVVKKGRVNQIDVLNHYREDFLPFADGRARRTAILKLSAESEHWYKVEVNGKTHEEKYILRSDPEWEKRSWSFLLAMISDLRTHDDQSINVYAKPGGDFIGAVPPSGKSLFRYKGKMDGDWAYIKVSLNSMCLEPPFGTTTDSCYWGWVRWRQGDNILVKANGHLIVDIREIKSDPKVNAGIRSTP